MSKQRMVKDSFWTDPYIEDLDPSEKLMFIYLLTNPLCNIAGIYEIRVKRIAYETGFDKDMVDKILSRFEKDDKLIRHKDWVIIKNFAKNQSTNPNVEKGIQRIIDELPNEVKALKGFERLSHFTLLNLTLPNLTDIPQKNKDVTTDVTNVTLEENRIEENRIDYNTQSETFNEFWDIYPKKVGKKKSKDKWKKLSEQDIKEILEDIPQRKNKCEKWIKGFIKDPERYIRDQQWKDEYIKPKKLDTTHKNKVSTADLLNKKLGK